MNDGTPDAPRAEFDRRYLPAVRHALLDLHKALVDFESSRYGKTMAPVRSPQQLLHLLTSDPWFAWLHPISQLIVAIDDALDEREPLTRELILALANQTRELLVASESGEGFARQYFDALQEDPDVVLAHAAVMKMLGSTKKPAGQGN